MQVDTLRKTPRPDELVCETARSDYMEEWVGDEDYSDIMATVSPDEEDEILAEDLAPQLDHLAHDDLTRTCRLVRKLMEQPGHFGPFEHPHVTFTVEGVSRITMAQLTRHRHISFDVQSMRYVSFDAAPDDLVIDIPEVEEAGLHGRGASYADQFEDVAEDVIQDERAQEYELAVSQAVDTYNALLDRGVAPENARAVLPIGTKVNMTFTMNLRALMHVADMRAAGDAQWEIRELTEELLTIAEDWAPVTMLTYEDQLKNRKNRLAP